MKKNNGPFSDFFKTMYIPLWRVAAAERKLKEYAAKGYEAVSFSPVGVSLYRVQFQCASPKDKNYYLFARFNAGGGPSLGYTSPCGMEERKISAVSKKTIAINGSIFAAELKEDAESAIVLKYRVEKLKAARKLYFSFLLFELAALPVTTLFFYLIVPHEIFFRDPIVIPPSLYPFAVFPIYAAIGTFVLSKELKLLRHT